jgi:hypothetical protein
MARIKNQAGVIAILSIFISFAAALLRELPPHAADPAPSFSDRCITVSKQEYESAYSQNYLRTEFSAYIRTGRLTRQHYWYCHS